MKKKTKNKIISKIAIKTGWIIFRLVGRTCSIKHVNQHYVDELIEKKENYIYALWHGRIFIPIYVHRYEGIAAMVSLHRDGEMIAQTLHKLGYKTIRGSSSKGGKEAFHGMVDFLKNGGIGCIIPDGPRGPRHKLKSGTIYISQQSDTYIVPACASSNRKYEFNSWDRFQLPKLFSKNVMIYGKPMKVEKAASAEELEKLRLELENRLIDLEKEADEYFRK